MDDTPQNLKEEVRHAIDLTRDGQLEEAIGIFVKCIPALTAGTIDEKRFAAAAMSYYGLCVALVQRHYAEGVKYCQISIRANSLDPEHLYNLARIYFERDDRRHTVEAIEKGLRLSPGHKRLNALLGEIGRRKKPVIPFLNRNNPLNVWLGKKRRRNQS